MGYLVLWAKSAPNTHPPERLVLSPAPGAAAFLIRPIAPARRHRPQGPRPEIHFKSRTATPA